MTIEITDPNPSGPLSEERLQTFEEELEVTLPLDYREFLKLYNGGQPEPSGFWVKKGRDGSSVHQFYGLHDGPKWFSIDCYAGVERYGTPEGLLAIGDDGTGNTICIGLEGENRGVIYFMDHEMHPADDPNSFEGIIRIADSFSEFLSSLRTFE